MCRCVGTTHSRRDALASKCSINNNTTAAAAAAAPAADVESTIHVLCRVREKCDQSRRDTKQPREKSGDRPCTTGSYALLNTSYILTGVPNGDLGIWQSKYMATHMFHARPSKCSPRRPADDL